MVVWISEAIENVDNVGESRKRRWALLNPILDINKKAIKSQRSDGLTSVGYSCVHWEQVKDIFLCTRNVVTGDGGTEDSMPPEMLNALYQYLRCATLCFGNISEGKEAKRVQLISPIIVIVCAKLGGSIQLLVEEDLDGERIHAHGHFEFVLKRNNKRICIVVAKKDDILQGKTQALVGCEAMADVENIDTVYGIATNYLEWCFLKNESNRITEELVTIRIEHGVPTFESVAAIANKIMNLLT